MLHDPAKVAVTPVASTVDRVEQRIIRVDRSAKPAVLAEILQRESIGRALVFTRTKHGADKVVRGLAKAGISAHAIHGNKSQNQRERAERFRDRVGRRRPEAASRGPPNGGGVTATRRAGKIDTLQREKQQ
jgi:superfamily II DNA/RNA helicase